MILRPKNLFFQAKIAKINLFFSKYTISSAHSGPNGDRIWIREVKFAWNPDLPVPVADLIGWMRVLPPVRGDKKCSALN